MILHSGLFVRSLPRSLEFYCEKMGFSVLDTARVEGPMVQFLTDHCYGAVQIALIRVADFGAKIELMEVQPDSRLCEHAFNPAPHHGAIAILVDDLRRFVKQRGELGVYPATDVFQVGMVRSGNCLGVLYRDPDEHLLEFLQVCE